ncbi:MAG: hypothetical protein U1C73_01415 [Dietzia sp.]|nr:hypothetical protein [Dietzia sp.]
MIFAATSAPFVGAAQAQESGESIEVTDAEFRWAINVESGTKAPAPGTSNFFSAGDVTGAVPGAHQQLPSAAWRGTEGSVVIEKCGEDDRASTATWESARRNRSGGPLGAGEHNGLEAVISGGTGVIDPETGDGEIRWDGTFTVVYYSGMTNFSVTDPVLEVNPTSARVTATLGGFRTDMEDTSVWERMPSRKVTIADLDRDKVDLTSDDGFVVTPAYSGVRYTAPAGQTPQVWGDRYSGSFPKTFVDFVSDAGSGPYWYSSGGAADRFKSPLPMNITRSGSGQCLADAADGGSGGGGTGGSAGGGLLSNVLNDFVEGVVYDASGILQTRIRDDLDSVVNGDANWSDLGSSDLTSGQKTGVSAGAAGLPQGGDSTTVGQDGDLPAEGTPVNAGTVGYAVTTATSADAGGPTSPTTSTSGGSSSGGSSLPAGSGPGTGSAGDDVVADNSYPLAASVQAEAGEVYYANTSTSSAAAPFRQWQWWAGGALLALAAGLVVQAIRGKV